jgi:hypothetical protein
MPPPMNTGGRHGAARCCQPRRRDRHEEVQCLDAVFRFAPSAARLMRAGNSFGSETSPIAGHKRSGDGAQRPLGTRAKVGA